MALTEAEIMAMTNNGALALLVGVQLGWSVKRATVDFTLAHQVEETVKLQDRMVEYTNNLRSVVQAEDTEGLNPNWLMLHASPLQRCKAYLLLDAVG